MKAKTFGEYVKMRREVLGKSIRSLATDLKITPIYLSDIEKGNRYAPEKHLERFVDVLNLAGGEVDTFYDLAGKSLKNNYPDLSGYIGSTDIARVALRKARDLEIPKEQWQQFIDNMEYMQQGKGKKGNDA